jgi:hypothetical protein
MDTDTRYPDSLAPNAREVFADLCSSLPKTAADPQEAIAARARKAMDAVFALRPEDAFEARLAVRIVAMDAHAIDALRAAANAVADPAEMGRCRAQAASMARQSDSALRALRRIQAERDKAFNAGHPATLGRAGYWFKEASVPGPDGDPGSAPPPTPDAEAEPERTPAVVEADARLYAVMYPDRVIRIRAAGGLPPDLDFGPPEPEIVDALLRSSDVLPGATNPTDRDAETESTPGHHRPTAMS